MPNWQMLPDDHADSYWAIGFTVTIHLIALLLVLTNEQGARQGGASPAHGAEGLAARQIEASEFRQKLVAVPAAEPIDMTPPLPEAQLEPERPEPVQKQASEPTATVADSRIHMPATQQAAPASKDAVGTSAGRASGASKSNEGGAQVDDDLREAYYAALKAAILLKWRRSDSVQGTCAITIHQTAGGIVLSSQAGLCQLANMDRIALEAAALLAQPLPYAGFESAFAETITLEIVE